MNLVRIALVAFAFSFGAAAEATAWSKYVHELICEMAFDDLTPQARSEVIRLSVGQNAAGG